MMFTLICYNNTHQVKYMDRKTYANSIQITYHILGYMQFHTDNLPCPGMHAIPKAKRYEYLPKKLYLLLKENKGANHMTMSTSGHI